MSPKTTLSGVICGTYPPFWGGRILGTQRSVCLCVCVGMIKSLRQQIINFKKVKREGVLLRQHFALRQHGARNSVIVASPHYVCMYVCMYEHF